MEKIIDIKEVIQSRKSGNNKKLPNFVINWIKKVIREDELNAIHNKYATLEGMDYVEALLFDEFKINITITGQENINLNKKYVYVSNHPLGGIDALSHLYLVHKIHGNVISPSNEMFEYIPNLHSLIVGIDVFNKNTKERAIKINQTFESDLQIMMFPAGEVSRKINGEIIDPKWQKTFITKAIQYKRSIVPVHISGRNSKKFYRTAQIRKFLHIKTYLETILLPQEMLKQRNIDLKMTIGKPFDYDEIKNSNKNHSIWSEIVRKHVYSLK